MLELWEECGLSLGPHHFITNDFLQLPTAILPSQILLI